MNMTLTEMRMNILTQLYNTTMEACECTYLSPEEKAEILHNTATIFCLDSINKIEEAQAKNDNNKKYSCS